MHCPAGGIDDEVEHADGHHQHGAQLSQGIAGESHEEREDGAAEQAHDHQAGNLVLLLRHGQQGLREDDGEDIAIAVADEGDADIDNVVHVGYRQPNHGYQHHQHADPQEGAGGAAREDERAAQATQRTEDEVERRGPRSFVERQFQAFHQQLGRGGVGTDVDAHVAHDAEEAQQDKRVAQQPQAGAEARSLVRLLFLDGRGAEPEDGEHGNHHVDGEEHAPVEPEVRYGVRCTPHGDVGGEERGDGLDELAEGEGRREPVTADDGRQQGIERRLHERVADAEE